MADNIPAYDIAMRDLAAIIDKGLGGAGFALVVFGDNGGAEVSFTSNRLTDACIAKMRVVIHAYEQGQMPERFTPKD